MNEVLIMSPRRGRTKIAQRFIAGIRSLCQALPAKRATDYPVNRVVARAFLSPVSRARPVFCLWSQH